MRQENQEAGHRDTAPEVVEDLPGWPDNVYEEGAVVAMGGVEVNAIGVRGKTSRIGGST